MKATDPAIQSARITAWQAIVIAAITALGSVATTLITTGNGPWRGAKETAVAAGTGERVASNPLLQAPNINFASTATDLKLDVCMTHARASIERAGLTGLKAKDYIAWGYQGQNTGLVWCNTDLKHVIFLAAGNSSEDTSELAEALSRAF